MSSADKAAQVAALIAAVKQVFGTSFIGFAVATTLYGITVLQTYFYYRRYTKDPWTLKATVALLWILDTLTTIFVAHSLYTFFVLNFSKDPQIDLIIPWSFTAEKLLVTLTTFVAQAFYARTIWRVGTSTIVPAAIMLFALVALALGLVTTVHLFENPLVTSISDRSFSILSGLVQGFASLDDILITAAMCWYLHIRRGSIKSTEQLIDTLMLYAVSRGIVTAICQILFLVLNVGLPHDTFWQPFHQAVGKLYVNSVLATLNVRSNFALPTEVELGTKGIHFASATPSSALGIDTSNARDPQLKLDLAAGGSTTTATRSASEREAEKAADHGHTDSSV